NQGLHSIVSFDFGEFSEIFCRSIVTYSRLTRTIGGILCRSNQTLWQPGSDAMKRMWVILLLLTGVAHGQTSRGTVTGTITDASGAIISGSSVLLTHTETGVRRFANSNEAGIYRFDAVDLGVYQIEVTQPGFRLSLITMVRVDANRATTIDARLDVGIT